MGYDLSPRLGRGDHPIPGIQGRRLKDEARRCLLRGTTAKQLLTDLHRGIYVRRSNGERARGRGKGAKEPEVRLTYKTSTSPGRTSRGDLRQANANGQRFRARVKCTDRQKIPRRPGATTESEGAGMRADGKNQNLRKRICCGWTKGRSTGDTPDWGTIKPGVGK